MEKLQGATINPCCFSGEQLDAECFEQGFVGYGSLRCDGEEGSFSMPSLEDKMPFLQILQSVECPPLFPLKEPNFQTLLRLQHLGKPWEMSTSFLPEMETHIQALELESCVTQEILDLHSPVKSETKGVENRYSASCLEVVSSEAIQDQPNSAVENCGRECSNSGSPPPENGAPQSTQITKAPPVTRERKKRKRTKPAKNKEEIESQRMTHIAVERNRRRQMNDHLNSLRSLMPPSYIQKGDQASIIGGAIDFVKGLEQLLQSLEAQKGLRSSKESNNNSTPISAMGIPMPKCGIGSEGEDSEEEVKAGNKAGATKVEVNVLQNHVNLKIQCPRKSGQLLQAIITLESLRLTVLHLNITSSQVSVLYSFNLKMEDDCKLKAADEIEAAVRQIFR